MSYATKVCFKKNGYIFAIVYSSKCVTVFLKQTLVANVLLSNLYTVANCVRHCPIIFALLYILVTKARVTKLGIAFKIRRVIMGELCI